jgi:hypothetical protein
MKTLIIWTCSFLLAGIIISPFFWLRFLIRKNTWMYVFLGTLLSFIFSMLYIFKVGDFTMNLAARVGADFYYFYDDVTSNSLIAIFLAVLISPFFSIKMVFEKFCIKSFFISLIISSLIFVIYAVIFVYVIFPMAVGGIFKALN